ncbi:MAG: hypothetical protein M0Q44_10940 [Methylobacter sp.]|nr:hypothetical protein [Methylobacter sp.]
MKRYNCLWVFFLMIVAGSSWAYGSGSSSSKACGKPGFTDFVPAENAEAAVGSSFSFTASANTYPNTIKVNVKGQPAAFKVEPKSQGGFQVSGTLPASLKGVYARIAIAADAQGNCKGEGGWLVKIAE